jgi:pyruvate,water dikinase
MGLDLLDVADAVRAHPPVVRFLETATGDEALEQLDEIPGGREVHDALRAYLEKYGMRCAGEIDITRERWAERPAVLFPMILSNVRNFEPGAAARRVEEGRREAADREQEILDRLRRLPGGARKAGETRRMIALMRSLTGYREYPKYGMISRYFVYKQALLAEAERLVRAAVISKREDIFYLTLDELRDVVATGELDGRIIDERKAAHALYERLTPPRVLTSDGEVIAGHYRREHLPSGALPGLAVSSGLVEGRARVVLRMEDADLAEGDILVTAYTDPSWTPLFVSIGGLVTEVGGLMTHGAVIAREYGIPAVVGVQEATRLIADGQRVRVHGTEGYVEVL